MSGERTGSVSLSLHDDIDLVVVCAPAGFGKTTLARGWVKASQAGAIVNLREADVRTISGALLEALEAEDVSRAHQIAEARAAAAGGIDGHWTTLATDAWVRPPSARSTFVFDNTENILADGTAVSFVAELLALRPSERRVVFCTRCKLPRELTRHALPHRTRHVTSEHLRLGLADIRRLMNGGADDGERASAIERISRGWPVAALLLIRFLRDGHEIDRIDRFEQIASAEYEPLFEYFADEYLGSLDSGQVGILKAAAALDAATVEELAALIAVRVPAAKLFIQTSPFLSCTEAGTVEAHPVVRAMIGRDMEAVASIRNAAADLARERGDFIRASEIFIEGGAQEEAAAVLCDAPFEDSLERVTRFAKVVSRLDVERVIENPLLWLRTIQFRYLAMGMTRYVDEARLLHYRMDENEDETMRAAIAKRYAVALLWQGRGDEALRVLGEARSAIACGSARQLVETEMAAVEATLGLFRRARERCIQAGKEDRAAEVQALLLDHIEAVEALRNGDYDRGIAFLEEAVRTERRSGMFSSLVTSLANLAFESWLQGDDTRAHRAVHELRKNLLPGQTWIWDYWLAAIEGDASARPHGDELPAIVSQASIFQASIPGPSQIEAARFAIGAADRCGDGPVRVLARIPLAEISRADRARVMGEILEIGASLELPRFVAAVQSYAKGEPEIGVLRKLVARMQSATPPSQRSTIDLTSGGVLCNGSPVAVSVRELAVLVFLGVAARVVSRDVLCDAMWPEADAEDAANNLKVVVHRIRRKLGHDTLVVAQEGYSLGPHVEVSIREQENFARSLRRTALRSADRAALNDLLGRLDVRPAQQLLKWDWYVATDHRLNELARQVRLILADDARRQGDETIFRHHVSALLQVDASDEEAVELLLRFYAARGERGAARSEIKRFVAAAEGDDSASARMQGLYDRLFATADADEEEHCVTA